VKQEKQDGLGAGAGAGAGVGFGAGVGLGAAGVIFFVSTALECTWGSIVFTLGPSVLLPLLGNWCIQNCVQPFQHTQSHIRTHKRKYIQPVIQIKTHMKIKCSFSICLVSCPQSAVH